MSVTEDIDIVFKKIIHRFPNRQLVIINKEGYELIMSTAVFLLTSMDITISQTKLQPKHIMYIHIHKLVNYMASHYSSVVELLTPYPKVEG